MPCPASVWDGSYATVLSFQVIVTEVIAGILGIKNTLIGDLRFLSTSQGQNEGFRIGRNVPERKRGGRAQWPAHGDHDDLWGVGWGLEPAAFFPILCVNSSWRQKPWSLVWSFFSDDSEPSSPSRASDSEVVSLMEKKQRKEMRIETVDSVNTKLNFPEVNYFISGLPSFWANELVSSLPSKRKWL